jgi:phytoene synthase
MAIEDAMVEVVTTSSQPGLGAIRLAWWREALERLDTNPPPAEPRLQEVAAELLARSISGKSLAVIEDGYATLLEEHPDADRVGAAGAALFAIGAKLLDVNDHRVAEAGQLHAFARAARCGVMAIPERTSLEALQGHRFPRALRPLTALARLAARDIRQAPNIEAEATPARAVALLSHKMFGTIA